eukprot:1708026-Pyramimonas_sp.AAC.1
MLELPGSSNIQSSNGALTYHARAQWELPGSPSMRPLGALTWYVRAPWELQHGTLEIKVSSDIA